MSYVLSLAALGALQTQLAADQSAVAALGGVVAGHTTTLSGQAASITANATAITVNTTAISANAAAMAAREQTANKGQANGYAPLDATGRVPAANLPATNVSTAFSRGAYAASGAIATTDTLSILNGSSGTLAMTLANGTSDGQAVLIKNFGSGSATVTGSIDGTTGAVVTLAAGSSGGVRDALKLRWSATDATWIAE